MDNTEIKSWSSDELQKELRKIENTDFDGILKKDLPSMEELKSEIEKDTSN